MQTLADLSDTTCLANKKLNETNIPKTSKTGTIFIKTDFWHGIIISALTFQCLIFRWLS